MKVTAIHYSHFSTGEFEHVRIYAKEEDAKKALHDALRNDEIQDAYIWSYEILEEYHNEMKFNI